MITYPSPLVAIGGARTGIAPVNLLDVEDVNGNRYFWSDRRIVAPYAIGAVSTTPAGLSLPVALSTGQRVAWIPPTVVTPVQGTHVVAFGDPTNGTLVLDYSWPFSAQGSLAWSGFAIPSLPPGAIIDAAYITGIATEVGSAPSVSDPLTLSGVQSSFAVPLSHIATTIISVWLNATVPIGAMTSTVTIQRPSIALYYHFAGGVPFTTDSAPFGFGEYDPWILTVPALTFHRSSVTDLGSFKLQNLSGDTISRDFEKILRASALEGAFFVYRCWQPDAQASWVEAHGQLSVEDVGVDSVTLKGAPAINPAAEDTPAMEYCETCQWRWSSPQCGATGSTECQYSYQSCQVLERILVVLNNYEKNFGEAAANVPGQVINRRRRF